MLVVQVYLLAPWLFGGLIALALYRDEQKDFFCPNFHIAPSAIDSGIAARRLSNYFLFGAGSLLGYLFVSAIVLLLMLLGIQATKAWLFIVLGQGFMALLSAYLLLVRSPLPITIGSRCFGRGKVYILGASCLIVIATAVLQGRAPLAAWDALHFWAPNSAAIINGSSDVAHVAQLLQSLGHPPLVMAILAWTGWVPEFFDHPAMFNPWILCCISIALMIYGAAYLLTQNWMISGALAIITISTPLIENHALLFGYAEVWLSASVLCATSFILFGLSVVRYRLVAIGLLITFLLPFIKNTGVVYFLVIWSAALTAVALPPALKLYSRSSLVFKVFSLLACGALVLTINYAVQSCLDNECLSFGSYVFSRNGYSLLEMLGNEYFSLFVNQSFSVLGLTLFFVLWVRLKRSQEKFLPAQSLAFILLVIIGLLLIPVLTQMMLYDTWLGKLYASPLNDTGNSRLTLPLITVIPLYVGTIINATIQAPEPDSRNL